MRPAAGAPVHRILRELSTVAGESRHLYLVSNLAKLPTGEVFVGDQTWRKAIIFGRAGHEHLKGQYNDRAAI
jgi:hypothetical protein